MSVQYRGAGIGKPAKPTGLAWFWGFRKFSDIFETVSISAVGQTVQKLHAIIIFEQFEHLINNMIPLIPSHFVF